MKQRKSNLEMLRIVAMLLIIAHHYSAHGVPVHIDGGILDKYVIFYQFMWIGGKLGVNVFVLITGYFYENAKSTANNLKKIYFPTLFYAITGFCISHFILHEMLTIDLVADAIFPVVREDWWFITAYILLMLVRPYINIVIEHIKNDKNRMKRILIVMFIWQSLIPTLFDSLPFEDKTSYGVNNLTIFVFLYCIGAFIKINENDFKSRKYAVFTIIFGLIIVANTIVLDWLGSELGLFRNSALSFMVSNSVFIMFMSACLFLSFVNLNVNNNVLINNISKLTFGIYLIHDSPFMRKFIWSDIIKVQNHYNKNGHIVYALLSIFAVFIVCGIIEFTRMAVFEFICNSVGDSKKERT